MNHPFYFHLFFLTAFVQVLLTPPDLWAGQGALSLEEVTQQALAKNPIVAAARARWRMAIQRIPREAAWEDPEFIFSIALGHFVQFRQRLHGSDGQPRASSFQFPVKTGS